MTQNTPSIPLRVADPADTDALTALIQVSVEAIFPAFYDAAQTASALAHIAVLDHSLVEDGTYFAAAAPTGQLVACGGWSRRLRLFNGAVAGPDDGRLLDPGTEPARVRAMFVHPDWTRRGLARAILVACEDAARAEGFTELTLMATMPGVPLYRSWGFTGGDPLPQVMPDGVSLDGLVMHRRITP
ncbi:MAG: GNAT family N-acetyltransferase [Sporichthyaceae bacterium]